MAAYLSRPYQAGSAVTGGVVSAGGGHLEQAGVNTHQEELVQCIAWNHAAAVHGKARLFKLHVSQWDMLSQQVFSHHACTAVSEWVHASLSMHACQCILRMPACRSTPGVEKILTAAGTVYTDRWGKYVKQDRQTDSIHLNCAYVGASSCHSPGWQRIASAHI